MNNILILNELTYTEAKLICEKNRGSRPNTNKNSKTGWEFGWKQK